MRTYDLAKRSEKFQHIIYKNISKSALRLYIVYKGKHWGLQAPQSVLMTQESSGSLLLQNPALCWCEVPPSSSVAHSLLIELRYPSECGKGASPLSLQTEE